MTDFTKEEVATLEQGVRLLNAQQGTTIEQSIYLYELIKKVHSELLKEKEKAPS